MWPFRKTETRQQGAYTDAIVQLLAQQANSETVAKPLATAAAETAAGLVQRSFALARVSGPETYSGAVQGRTLADSARWMFQVGEAVWLIRVERGKLKLYPCATWYVDGGVDPDAWVYDLTITGPTNSTWNMRVPGASVLHFRYAYEPAFPWKGIGPVQQAVSAGRLSAELAESMANEASGPVGHLLPMPGTDGNDDTVADLKADLKKLKGNLALVESMKGGWGADTVAASPSDWSPKRIGPEYSQYEEAAFREAYQQLLGVFGVPTAMLNATNQAALREAWRVWLFGVVAPLGALMAQELQAKLDPAIRLEWDELRASDVQGRARAFQSMVGGGMDVAKAAALSGLLIED